MGDLGDHSIDLPTLRRMYEAWSEGATKSELERGYLAAPQAHGKLFTSLVREHLGIETEKRSAQSARIEALEKEVARLRAVLKAHGINDQD